MTRKAYTLLLVLFYTLASKAQLYTFVASNVNYTPEISLDTLWGRTSWSANASFDTTVDVKLPKYLNFYSRKINQVSIQKNGAMFLFSRKFPTNTIWGAYNTFRSIDKHSIIGMHFQKQTTDTTSIVIEYHNVGFVGKSDSEYVNFKIILHYDTDSIDIIYGPSFTTSSTWSSVGGVIVGLDTGISKEAIQFLSGSPDSPELVNNNINSRLNSFPKEGTKYTFFPQKKVALNVLDLQPKLLIYPNPSANIFTLEYNTEQKEELTIINSLGEQVYKDNYQKGHIQENIDITSYPKGLYIIRIGNTVQKIIKQ